MTTEDQTGVEEQDPTNTAGDGSDGAAGQKSKEATVPLAALEAERKSRQKLEGKLAKLLGEVEGLKAGQQKPKEETVYTRTQLRALVNEGKITEDQMDAQLEKQLRAEVEKSAQSAVMSQTQASKISAELARYTEAHPDLTDEDSDLRARVVAEFKYLVDLGDNPNSLATELKAVRAVLGASGAPKGKKKTPETHEEAGSSGEDVSRGTGADAWAKGLSAKQKEHYTKLVNQGVYKGFGDKTLQKEVELARSRMKRAN